MIIDSHLYCFEPADQPAGFASAQEHLRWVQAAQAGHRDLPPPGELPYRLHRILGLREKAGLQHMADAFGAPPGCGLDPANHQAEEDRPQGAGQSGEHRGDHHE